MSNYAKINDMDVVNGEGIRVSIFFSGCQFHCRGCFNSELWDSSYGVPFTPETAETIIKLMKPDYINGLSILGGEPFEECNVATVHALIRFVKLKYPDKTIWIYTGYKFEELSDDIRKYILPYVDVIVDGRYEDDKRDLTLAFKGSSNQRIWRKINDKWVADDT